jgi:hypothetical protein
MANLSKTSDTEKQTNDLLQRLRQFRGSINEISKRSNKSRVWVGLVLRGEWPDPNVIKIATEVLKERFDKEASIMSSVEDVVVTTDVSRIRSLATV